MQKVKRHVKRVSTGVVGAIVVLLGIVMIPYPGPGWLVVFAGLAILSTEFAWAHDILARARKYYDSWVAWLKTRSRSLRLVLMSCTGAVVVMTIWMVNGYGLIDSWLGLGYDWAHSPFLT